MYGWDTCGPGVRVCVLPLHGLACQKGVGGHAGELTALSIGEELLDGTDSDVGKLGVLTHELRGALLVLANPGMNPVSRLHETQGTPEPPPIPG